MHGTSVIEQPRLDFTNIGGHARAEVQGVSHHDIKIRLPDGSPEPSVGTTCSFWSIQITLICAHEREHCHAPVAAHRRIARHEQWDGPHEG